MPTPQPAPRERGHSPRAVSVPEGAYLDYAATTPVDPAVARAMSRFLTPGGVFGNPSSITHRFGNAAREAVDRARGQIAALIGTTPGEIVWTSGATESINLALKGVMLSSSLPGRHFVVSAVEHKATLDAAQWLSSSGFGITIVAPDSEGRITAERIQRAIRQDTALVSLMHVNNELGTVTDVGSIARVLQDAGVLFHVDAAQSAARLPVNVSQLGVDLLSLSAHKMYGPKGIGALFVRRSLQAVLVPQTHGGGQEAGLRPGTLPTHQIAGMGEAANLVLRRREEDTARVAELDELLLRHLTRIPGCVINGSRPDRIPGILNVAFAGVTAESLMVALGDVAISNGSACTTATLEPSHVLLALGRSRAEAFASLRFSIGRFTTKAEIDLAGTRVREAVSSLRSLAA